MGVLTILFLLMREAKTVYGTEIYDDRNFYDLLVRDIENDGVSDRYANDFEMATILNPLMMWKTIYT